LRRSSNIWRVAIPTPAATIGVTIPPSMLAMTGEVIE
jgi:hypothetical protein